MSFFAELKRRNVFKVGIAYVVASWLLLQLTEVLTELLEIGPEVGKIVIVLLVVGFVPVLIFAWAFEMTPAGIRREKDVDRSQSVAAQTGRKLDRIIIVFLALALTYFVWESRFREQPEPVPATDAGPAAVAPPPTPEAAADDAPQQKSIAVLPFVNMSNDPDQEYFSDGLSEEILNALVKIDDLRVISRTSAFAFKGKDVSIPDIAAQLDVSHVLEGSVRKAGNDVRITAQLIEVATDSHLWSEAYSRALENVFDIQAEISAAIARALQVELGTPSDTSKPTENLEAYQLYLRGRHIYQRRSSMSDAIELFDQALELDPDFDEAWANLGAARMVRSFRMGSEAEQEGEAAFQAAAHALSLNPSNGLAYAVQGLYYASILDWDKAIAALDEAIGANPNESNSRLWKGIVLSNLGYLEKALAELERAETGDPVFENLLDWLGRTNSFLGRMDQLRGYIQKLAGLNEGWRAAAHLEQAFFDRDYALAKTLIGEGGQMDGVDNWEGLLDVAFSVLDNPENIGAGTQALNKLAEQNGTDAQFLMVRIGATREAVETWRRLKSEGRHMLTSNLLGEFWNIKALHDPNHPALKELLSETGHAAYWRQHGFPPQCRPLGDDDFECSLGRDEVRR